MDNTLDRIWEILLLKNFGGEKIDLPEKITPYWNAFRYSPHSSFEGNRKAFSQLPPGLKRELSEQLKKEIALARKSRNDQLAIEIFSLSNEICDFDLVDLVKNILEKPKKSLYKEHYNRVTLDDEASLFAILMDYLDANQLLIGAYSSKEVNYLANLLRNIQLPESIDPELYRSWLAKATLMPLVCSKPTKAKLKESIQWLSDQLTCLSDDFLENDSEFSSDFTAQIVYECRDCNNDLPTEIITWLENKKLMFKYVDPRGKRFLDSFSEKYEIRTVQLFDITQRLGIAAAYLFVPFFTLKNNCLIPYQSAQDIVEGQELGVNIESNPPGVLNF